MFRCRLVTATALCFSLLGASAAFAAPSLLAYGSIPSSLGTDLSGRSDLLENGDAQNVLGGLGSGLAYAGNGTFIAIPDRGPNAESYNANVDNTTSYIFRFQTLQLALTPSRTGSLPLTLVPTLTATTLLYSSQPLNYGGVPGGTTVAGTAMPAGNAINAVPSKYYFTGRSDNFGSTNGTGTGSANQFNARFDPEGVRVSNDGKTVFISDEYGPYLYQFDRATGERLRTYTLPSNLYVANQSAIGKNEEKGQTPGNTSGRVDNKGMEGLAITPDGKTLIGAIQAPTVQDGKSSNLLRLVSVDIATGATHEYGYKLTTGSGVSEIVALNDHQFIVDERDGAGVGGDQGAGVKDFYLIDLTGATDITALGTSAASAVTVSKIRVLDFAALLVANGISVPSKIEGLAFGSDVSLNGTLQHTLYVSNDNDFTPADSGANQFFVVGFSDADFAAFGATFQAQLSTSVPEPASLSLLTCGVLALGWRRRSCRT